ncbi:helix-turn-helix transcriptional regulator [Aestuariibacter sp. AA17]|uniref:Helix-turn-helix transcriptional regulator n=1 Tax=Fluctibacter corallii TaxID=2984329 RepID=A0ABT3A751_9ALTE|nr:helix-turn-helix transcriptional regulator [Aestuariibacter sp. AA17]MCV2884394.1 helix-turn-helix transcriptional regulator [Aestuariibacter sp. AA17]
MTLLSEELKAKRINAGLSQEALAERLNVGVYLIQAIEEGKTAPHQALSKSAMLVWQNAGQSSTTETIEMKPKITTSVERGVSFISLFIVIGMLFFLYAIFMVLYSDADNHDKFNLIAVLSISFIARRDKDLVFTSLLYSASLLINEFAFVILKDSSFEISMALYISALISVHFLAKNYVMTMMYMIIFSAISMEIIWYLKEIYRPDITWYIHCAFINTLIIKTIKTKLNILHGKHYSFISLSIYDKFFLFHSYCYFWLILLMVIEYGVRHILHFNTLIVYNLFLPIQWTFNLIFISLLVESVIRLKPWKKAVLSVK